MHQDFAIKNEYIALNDLLKVCGVVDSGGAGKMLVAAGEISVDGAVVSDKCLKLDAGSYVVQVGKRKFARVSIS